MRVTELEIAIPLILFPLLLQGTAQAQAVRATAKHPAVIKHDISPPLRTIAPVVVQGEEPEEEPAPRPTEPQSAAPRVPDPVVQKSVGQPLGTIDLMNFDGLGKGAYGFSVSGAPPDTNGAVGATQYMQWVNSSFAVFDKTTGDLLFGPARGVTLFTDFGPPCETRNGGDGIILYDKTAGQWMFSQINDATTVCIAVSTSSDATGTYYRYAFDLSNVLPAGTTLSDYPKFGVWPDGYYYTANIFGATSGTNICAFDRANMLVGNDASAQCFFSQTVGGSYLPADLDGSLAPPDGSPNFLVDINNSGQELRLLRFHADWNNPNNSTLSDAIHIPTAPFTRASGGVPQLDSTAGLDTLGDRLMFRLGYRNFGDHESLVVNHSVQDPSTRVTGARWYELQDPNGATFIYQQGTFTPDSTYRWMGSIAMDRAGNIGLAYSASSPDIYPAVRYTGRTPDDPRGTLEDEKSIIEGGGSQQPTTRQRWGDYSAITIDPIDDCTFWFTTEYYQTSGSVFNWNTRIASFRFPSCGLGPPWDASKQNWFSGFLVFQVRGANVSVNN